MNLVARNLAGLPSHPLWTRISSEFRDSRLIRLGLVGIGAIIWIYCVLVLSDSRAPARERLALLEDRLATAREEERDKGWPAREAAAKQQLAALRSLLWKAPTRSLAEASFRDWIQQTAQATGLKVRSLAVQTADQRAASNAASTPPSATGGSAAAALLPADVDRVRARLSADFDRQTWAMFLLTLSGSARIVNVERLAVHSNSGQAATAELDLEALFALEAPGA